MTINPENVKPGDTVRVRYSNAAMVANGVEPFEFTSVVYRGIAVGDMHVGSVRMGHPTLTILEHTPARPDWADALVARGKDGKLWLKGGPMPGGDEFYINSAGVELYVTQMQEDYAPITVVLDADGNPPAAEVEWLDADALDALPLDSVTLGSFDGAWPRWKGPDGKWRHTGQIAATGKGYTSAEIAPARLLWKPEP